MTHPLNEVQSPTDEGEEFMALAMGIAEKNGIPWPGTVSNAFRLMWLVRKHEAALRAQQAGWQPIETADIDFGDYVTIEQKRYGTENEMYIHKVIGILRSNCYVDVPVQTPATETSHEELVDVVACVCCGVSEREVLRYKLDSVKKAFRSQPVAGG